MEKALYCQSWDEYDWPDWVPVEIREQIKSFWGPKSKRKPKQWVDNAVQNKAPKMGIRIRTNAIGTRANKVTGKFIFAWNNIGRLILENGEYIVCGWDDFEVSRDGMWQRQHPKDYQGFTVGVALDEITDACPVCKDKDIYPRVCWKCDSNKKPSKAGVTSES